MQLRFLHQQEIGITLIGMTKRVRFAQVGDAKIK